MELDRIRRVQVNQKLRGELSDKLTQREKQVVLLLCLGLKEAAVAHHLHICPATVHSHITRVHRKLGVTSRGLLVARAIVEGAICIEELAAALNRSDACCVHENSRS
jgi:DNA-binding NarL/FixJ family response regulator